MHEGGKYVSKSVIILLVMLGHFPPQLQAEGVACSGISVEDEGVLGSWM
jgi:hypothetical protein